jgi:hypothetical protein
MSQPDKRHVLAIDDIALDVGNDASAPVDADGWMRIAPHGKFAGVGRRPDGKGGWEKIPVIQEIDADVCNEIVRDFHSAGRTVLRFFRGVPVYFGHPDQPCGSQFAHDTDEKGIISQLQARDDGLYALWVINEAGEVMLGKTPRLAPSPRFRASAPEERDGKLFTRPNRLRSVGMTQRPNFPLEVVNSGENPAETVSVEKVTEPTMKKTIAALQHAGITIANEADDVAVAAAIEPALGRITTLETDVSNERTAHASTKTELANERKARVGLLLDYAKETGRITDAERPAWERRLNLDLVNEQAAILGLSPKVKLASTAAAGAADRKANADGPLTRKNAKARFLDLVNEAIAADKGVGSMSDKHARAWSRTAAEHPEVYKAWTDTNN